MPKFLSMLKCDHVYDWWKDPIAEGLDKKEGHRYFVYKIICSKCGKVKYFKSWWRG